MEKILKILPALVLWGIFAYVIFNVPYPTSLTQANTWQTLFFFASLFLALTFTVNIFLKFLPFSATIAFGLILLLILKAIDTLNLATASLTLLAVYLFLSYFKKAQKTPSFRLKNLNNQGKLKSLRR